MPKMRRSGQIGTFPYQVYDLNTCEQAMVAQKAQEATQQGAKSKAQRSG